MEVVEVAAVVVALALVRVTVAIKNIGSISWFGVE